MKGTKLEKKGSMTGRLLRLINSRGNLQRSLSLQEENVNNGFLGNIYHDNRKEISAAMLEAESKKAKALMGMEKQRFM